MKKILVVMMMVAFIAFAGMASACPPDDPTCDTGGVVKTWGDVWNPYPDLYFTPEVGHYEGYGAGKHWVVDTAAFNTASYTFNIVDAGFVPGEDYVWSYKILFNFGDDWDIRDPWSESAQVTVDSVTYTTTSSWLWTIEDLDIMFNLTTHLNVDGTLNATITRTSGDFYFYDATLTAKGCDYPAPPTPTPEPASMLLLGLGLMGLVGMGRKLKK